MTLARPKTEDVAIAVHILHKAMNEDRSGLGLHLRITGVSGIEAFGPEASFVRVVGLDPELFRLAAVGDVNLGWDRARFVDRLDGAKSLKVVKRARSDQGDRTEKCAGS